ncbi:MAG TPA: hypothetical protein V6C97_28810 [Oculatellaceae cyanobacterium]
MNKNARIAVWQVLLLTSILALSGLAPAAAQDGVAQLSQLERIAFKQTQSGTDDDRLTALEKRAYGAIHPGSFAERIMALQQFMGVSATRTPDVQQPSSSGGIVNSPQLSPQEITKKTLLEAGVRANAFKLETGDDERFGGLWIGTLSSKIDPHVNVFCELHGSGSHFTGTMIWTSAVCGGCRRNLVGSFDRKEQACMMRDVSVEALNRHNAPRFCKVERYAFGVTENAEKLAGWFHSAECHDEGAVSLTRYRERE